jgi:hypothetical protein
MNLVNKNIPVNRIKSNINSYQVEGRKFIPSYYKGFYFVPHYALEHIYFGISNKTKFYGFDRIFSNFFDYLNDSRFARNYRAHYPKPDRFVPYNQFKNHYKGLIEAKSNFYFLQPKTFLYNFFVGLYLFVIWQLGGGFRFSPVHDDTKIFPTIGFYDLRLTPLAAAFRYQFRLIKFFQPDFRFPKNYYLSNPHSIHIYKFHPKSFDKFSLYKVIGGSLEDYAVPLKIIVWRNHYLVDAFFCFVFHFFFRTLFIFIAAGVTKFFSIFTYNPFSYALSNLIRMGITKLVYDYTIGLVYIKLFERFWFKTYFDYTAFTLKINNYLYYFETFRTARPFAFKFETLPLLKFISYHSAIFRSYLRGRYVSYFGVYPFRAFAMSKRDAVSIYKEIEASKFNHYKLIVLNQHKYFNFGFSKYRFLNYFVSKINFYLLRETKFHSSYILKTFLFLTKYGITEPNRLINRSERKLDKYYAYLSKITLPSQLHALFLRTYENYKKNSSFFQLILKSRARKYSFFNPLIISLTSLGYLALDFMFFTVAFIRFLRLLIIRLSRIRWLPLYYMVPSFYRYVLNYIAYIRSPHIATKSLPFKIYAYLPFFFGYYKQFEIVYEFTVFASLYFIRLTYNFCRKVAPRIHSFYTYTFLLFARPIATIFYWFYLEIRYISIFIFNFFSYYRLLWSNYFHFSIIYDYQNLFKKFYIGAKFFRFFTREIGEDLEDTPFNGILDLDDDTQDYLSDFPAYSDFHSSFFEYEQGYNDFDDEFYGSSLHYYDYFFPSNVAKLDQSDSNYPALSNLEFFAEDYYEEENNLYFQLFTIWTSPALYDFFDTFPETFPYQAKDYHDASWNRGKPNFNQWYPLELIQNEDYDEEHFEFYAGSGDLDYGDKLVSETTAFSIVPFDTDRARLSAFVNKYYRKLNKWHSYQVNNNFIKLPQALKHLPVPRENLPVTLADWKKATKAVTEALFTKSQNKRFAFKIDTLDDMQRVWGRISYELERNPQKLYEFLTNKKFDGALDSLNFDRPVKKNSPFLDSLKSIFKPKDPALDKDVAFVKFVNDYFAGYSSTNILTDPRNVPYKLENQLQKTVLLFYLISVAKNDHKRFIEKFFLLSNYPQFSDYVSVFDVIAKYDPSLDSVLPAESSEDPLVDKFIYAYYHRFVKSNIPTALQIIEVDGLFFSYTFPKFAKRLRQFLLPFSYLTKRKKVLKELQFDFYGKLHFQSTWREKVFAYFDRVRKSKLLSYEGKRAKVVRGDWPYSESKERLRITFEHTFSKFFEDGYASIILSFKARQKLYYNRIFREFTSSIPYWISYYKANEFEHVMNDHKYKKFFKVSRSYFKHDQLIEGEIWNTLNPSLEDFFYEVYYLNSNLIFPSNFQDYSFSNFFSDEFSGNGQDLYDDYIFIAGVNEEPRELGEKDEDMPYSHYEENDDDPQTLDASDETLWDFDFFLIGEGLSYDQGLSDRQELTENAEGQEMQPFWHGHEIPYILEHFDNDEGLEEWEPDEFDAMYDVDQSIDRLFFGGLKRDSHFPATDPRLFFGPLWQGQNIDRDLDYAESFKLAKLNSECKELVVSGMHSRQELSSSKNPYSYTKITILALYRILIYVLAAIRSAFLIFFFSNFDNPKYYKLLTLRSHYLTWYAQYSAFQNYKSRLDDWMRFFEEFRDTSTFKDYVFLNKKQLIAEPQTKSFLNDPYGRFWFQYPNTNHLHNFTYIMGANLIDLNYRAEDLGFKVRNDGRSPLDKRLRYFEVDFYNHVPEDAGYDLDKTSDLRVFDAHTDLITYTQAYSFLTSDPDFNLDFFKKRIRKKLKRITSYPWYQSRNRVETVGSDFTYLDFMFIEDIPFDQADHNSRIDEETMYTKFYDRPEDAGWYNPLIGNNRYGIPMGSRIPSEGDANGLANEETDWDIGSITSYSSDDFNTHLDDFSGKLDILMAALNDFWELILDYSIYYFYYLFRKYFVVPYRFWEIRTNSLWLSTAANYGLWIIVVRNFFNISLFLVLSIYGYFTISRLSYYYFGDVFLYGVYGFITFIIFFFYLVYLLRFMFKSVNDYYKSVDSEEKFFIFFALGFFYYFFNLNGYLNNPYRGWDEGSSFSKPLMSNNFNARFRKGIKDFVPYTASSFQRTPEYDGQTWYFLNGKIWGPRYKLKRRSPWISRDRKGQDKRYIQFNSFNLGQYPPLLNPYNFVIMVRYHFINISRENFVGYRKILKNRVRRRGMRAVRHGIYQFIHRPATWNWMHITSDEADDIYKRAATVAAISKGRTKYYYANNRRISRDRSRRARVEFVNPIDQQNILTFYKRNFSKSRLPYDFRQQYSDKRIFNNRSRATYGSEVRHLNKFVRIKGTSYPIDVPPYRRRDVVNHKDPAGDGGRVGTLRSKKYRRSAYTLFGRRFEPKFGSVYKSSIKTLWAQRRIADQQFKFTYSNNLLKYLFLFNPSKNVSANDLYGLSFRDLFPYPELIGHSHEEIPRFLANKDYLSLDKDKRARYYKSLEVENMVGMKNVYQVMPKKRIKRGRLSDATFPIYRAHFEEPTTASVPLYKYVGFGFEEQYFTETFYDTFWHRFNMRRVGYKKAKKGGIFRKLLVYRFKEIYHQLAWKASFYRTKSAFKNFIRNTRLKSLNEIRGFFDNYTDILEESLTSGTSDDIERDAKHAMLLAITNRTFQIKQLHNHFKFIKLANRFATKDYFRDSISYINPYKSNKTFYFNSNFYGQLIGLQPLKGVEDGEDYSYDPYFYFKDKDYRKYSDLDNRLGIFNTESEFMYPVYDLEKRFNRDTYDWITIDDKSVELTFGWNEYWLIEVEKITWWDILMDMIFVKDIIEEAETYGGQQYESRLPYKFIESDYHLEHRFHLFNPRSFSEVKDVNTFVFKEKPEVTPSVLEYINAAGDQYSEFVKAYYKPERTMVHDVIDELPRYSKYIRKAWAGMVAAPGDTNRYNFKQSRYYNRFATRNWIKRLKAPKNFLRQKRKPYFGRNLDSEERMFGSQVRRKHKKFGSTALSKKLKWQGLFNLAKLNRARMLYPSPRSLTGGYFGYPHNQSFIKIFSASHNRLGNYINYQYSFFKPKSHALVNDKFLGIPHSLITHQNYKALRNRMDFPSIHEKSGYEAFWPPGFGEEGLEVDTSKMSLRKAARDIFKKETLGAMKIQETKKPDFLEESEVKDENLDVPGQFYDSADYFEYLLMDPGFEVDYYDYIGIYSQAREEGVDPEKIWFYQPDHPMEKVPFKWVTDERLQLDNVENRSRPEANLGKVDTILARADYREESMELRKYGRVLTEEELDANLKEEADKDAQEEKEIAARKKLIKERYEKVLKVKKELEKIEEQTVNEKDYYKNYEDFRNSLEEDEFDNETQSEER